MALWTPHGDSTLLARPYPHLSSETGTWFFLYHLIFQSHSHLPFFWSEGLFSILSSSAMCWFFCWSLLDLSSGWRLPADRWCCSIHCRACDGILMLEWNKKECRVVLLYSILMVAQCRRLMGDLKISSWCSSSGNWLISVPIHFNDFCFQIQLVSVVDCHLYTRWSWIDRLPMCNSRIFVVNSSQYSFLQWIFVFNLSYSCSCFSAPTVIFPLLIAL